VELLLEAEPVADRAAPGKSPTSRLAWAAAGVMAVAAATGFSQRKARVDGSVTDEHEFVAIGGHAEDLMELLKTRFTAGWDLATAVKTAVEVLGSPESRTIEADAIEAGVLDRTRSHRRKFLRLEEPEIAGLLAG